MSTRRRCSERHRCPFTHRRIIEVHARHATASLINVTSFRASAITRADVEAVVAAPSSADRDEEGNPRLTGPDANGRAIIVVVADEDPGFVITTFPDG
jgi:hypothetical protein